VLPGHVQHELRHRTTGCEGQPKERSHADRCAVSGDVGGSGGAAGVGWVGAGDGAETVLRHRTTWCNLNPCEVRYEQQELGGAGSAGAWLGCGA
jgi:hypothetical protein